MIRQIVIPTTLRKQIEREAYAAVPAECCGLLEGILRFDTVVAEVVHPTPNLALRKDRFEIDPADHFRLLRAARAAGREVVGCYHSHPNGNAHPSGFDTACAAEEDFVWLIAAVTADDCQIGAFCCANGSFRRISMLQALQS